MIPSQLIVLCIFLFAVVSQAQNMIKTCLWQPTPQSISLMIPAIVTKQALPQGDKSLCKNAVQKYVNAVNADADLRQMLGGSTLQIPAESTYTTSLLKRAANRPLLCGVGVTSRLAPQSAAQSVSGQRSSRPNPVI